MQRQAEEGSSYERRLEQLSVELQSLRKMIQTRDEAMGQMKQETDQYREKAYNLEQELARKIEEVNGL
jgi:uncharacterized coiled-coil DUF342 family protein